MASPSLPPRVLTVAKDEKGEFSTVQDAIDAVPLSNTRRTIIRVSPGVYNQPIYVAKTKNFITLAGCCPETTLLTWHNTASHIDHHQTSRVIGVGTFGCGSVIVEGEDFIAENITFENSAPEGSGQAVAVRATADRCAFYNCRFLGWQDTLYLHYGRQYLRDCYIEGSVDFIFGNSTALLEHCHIHCKSQGYITAQSRKSSQETTGYVFLRCVITGNGGTSYSYLGRPWGPFGRVIFAYTWMDACIKPAGWNNWNKAENERSACFYEFRCSGQGSCLSKRVHWSRELVDEEADQFLLHDFIDPDIQRPWLCQRMGIKVPYSA
ncbi:hypothetical protein MRB53_028657 [Persea americana]|uniref:Uncharacterized protein n=1 Tax=Persea americana TaxID=3435 RepID=A0ACC2KGS4_PERAE|nr:hypothetical protein MRB53_028657 [Persea americana]|eukprot:TRINITY_DN3035_c0_g1_i1.p1 TRINITY_DN3035_c0_g1~~TRINITY_DN3035_c0_g1_i1.p1  ORF type:complete len:322 (-),score=42.55 TRINITY_DN3035_c0_g1_i1:857-1822(-)